MLATAPAGLLFRNTPQRSGVSGTIWAGEAGLAGGLRLAWQMAPLRSLTSLGFAADWSATGTGTDLRGRMLVHPGGRVVLDKVAGAADGTLLQALQPDLPFTCTLPMQLAFDRIAVHGGERAIAGRAQTEPGSCRARRGGVDTPVPALAIEAQRLGTHSQIRVVPATQRRRTLVSFDLAEDGRLAIQATPDGAATLPFLGLPPGARIEAGL